MSFPNPDNYARDCDCGTAGANTTPPPATLVTEAEAAILTNPFLLPNGGTIDTRNKAGTGGSINTSGDDDTASGGSINTSAFNGHAGGSINTRAIDNPGGSILTYGHSNGNGGTINLSSEAVGTSGTDAPHIVCGTGVPSAALPNGSLFLRVNGTASTTLYVRAAGAWSALS